MEPAELLDQLLAGPEMKVVGVREDHGCAGLAHLLRMKRLHGRFRPDRHEGGRRNVAVGRVNGSDTGRAVRRLEGEAGHAREDSGRSSHRISIASPKE